MIEVPLIGDTVSHEQIGEHKSSKVIIKPAAPGTGVKAGITVRSILQTLGVHNILTKSVGRNNPLNVSKATMNALKSMRSVEEMEKLRGKKVYLRHPQWNPKNKEGQPDAGETAEEEAEEELESEEKDNKDEVEEVKS